MKTLLLSLLLGQELPEAAKTAWGRIEYKADAVWLHVETWPADGKLAFPRLNNPIGVVYLQSDAKKTGLGFQPNLTDWVVTKPKDAPAPAVVVVEVKGAPRIAAQDPPLVEPGADGVLVLSSHLGAARGKMLRYEPQPHKNTLGYWVDPTDWCEWRFKIPKPGRYTVKLLQGCGKGQGGSTIQVKAAGQSLDFTVEDTGHFQNFVEREAGKIVIAEAGSFTLEIRPVKKAKAAVMDVREVRLVPVE